jgi:Asp/Glu/hydantoin racemase
MALRIWWQSSTTIHEPALDDYRKALTEHLESFKREDVEISVNGVDRGSLALDFNATVQLNSFAPGGVLDKILRAEREGFDGVAIGCFLDPAMQEARELVNIPIFGLGETSMHMACMLGERFSGVAFADKQAQYYDRKAREYGLGERLVPFESLGIDLAEVQKGFERPEIIRQPFIEACRRAMENGAEVILPACACVNAIVYNEGITEIEGALVLDINAVLLKIAEAMTELSKLVGAARSRKLLFASPPASLLENLMATYRLGGERVGTA